MKKIILLIIATGLIGGGVYALVNIMHKNEVVDQTNTPSLESVKNETGNKPKTEATTPALLKQGTFTDTDDFHKGSGTVQVLNTNEGKVAKFSSDFMVTKGPDLYVYFSKTADENEKDPGDYVSLGKLQNTSGEQIYTLPEDLDGYKSIVIWCRAFKTTFSVATLN